MDEGRERKVRYYRTTHQRVPQRRDRESAFKVGMRTDKRGGVQDEVARTCTGDLQARRDGSRSEPNNEWKFKLRIQCNNEWKFTLRIQCNHVNGSLIRAIRKKTGEMN